MLHINFETFISLSLEIPIYHILNARITFGNLNGCEEAGVGRTEADVDGQKDSPRTDTPSPASDSSSVSSSSSTSENQPVPYLASTSKLWITATPIFLSTVLNKILYSDSLNSPQPQR